MLFLTLKGRVYLAGMKRTALLADANRDLFVLSKSNTFLSCLFSLKESKCVRTPMTCGKVSMLQSQLSWKSVTNTKHEHGKARNATRNSMKFLGFQRAEIHA